jgi:hypothetical protein
LKTYHLERAWYNGLMPDGCEQEISPYIAKIEHMIETSTRCSVTYQALRSHGASLLGSDLEICPQLRIFMNEVLRGQRMPPLTLGAPKVSPGRDPVIYAIMVDICLGFCVSPTRNKASASRESACDILAAAMPRAGRLPKTYGSLERIWIKGQREY